MDHHTLNEKLEFRDYESSDRCFLLKIRLRCSIDCLIHYIFEGQAEREEWESLFRTLSQAVFIKEYLDIYNTNLLSISEDFLKQYNDWMTQRQAKLNN